MKKFYLIIFSILFLFSNSNAETFTAALKKAYDTNPELNAERESLNISEQELKVSRSSYLPTVTLEELKVRKILINLLIEMEVMPQLQMLILQLNL